MNDDDKPRKLPKRFRASADPADPVAFALLRSNDEHQAELGATVNSPFAVSSPLDAMRSKAFITINAIEAAANYTPAVVEQLAEAYATVGRYDKAAELSQEHSELYKRYWTAVWLADEDWCAHGREHKYQKDTVFSVKENRTMPLLACNYCGTYNVLDAPKHLADQQAKESAIRAATAGMSMEQTRAFLKKQVS